VSAGFYLARAGFEIVLWEKDRPGGKAARIPVIGNYPGFPSGISGKALMRRMLRQARVWKLRILRSEAVAVRRRAGRLEVEDAGGGLHPARAVIAATGAAFDRLGVPGEEGFQGRGLENAVWEKAQACRRRRVGVVGGGETAAHQALALAEHAGSVEVFVRGKGLRGIAPLLQRVRRHPRIHVRTGARIQRLLGNGRLSGVEWVSSGGAVRRSGLDTLFVLVGQSPNLPRLPAGRTEGLFIAGDAREGNFRQVSIAAADGLARAMDCERFLRCKPRI